MEQEFRAYGTLFSFVCTDDLVSSCEQYALCGRSAGHHAFARSLVAFQRNTADRGFRFVLHLLFRFGRSVPMSHDEVALFDLFLELFVGVDCNSLFRAVVECFLEAVLLDFFQQVLNICFDVVASYGFFLQCITTHHFDRIVFQVASAHSQTYGNAFQFVFGKLPSRLLVVGIVEFDRDA